MRIGVRTTFLAMILVLALAVLHVSAAWAHAPEVNMLDAINQLDASDQANDTDQANDIDPVNDIDQANDIDQGNDFDQANDIDQGNDFDQANDIDQGNDIDQANDIDQGNDIDQANDMDHGDDTDQVYEAESAANFLTGRARVVFCADCSGGFKVGDLYQGSSMIFRQVRVDVAGYYRVSVDYISGDPRPLYVSVNDGPHERYDFPSTGDWSSVGRTELILLLREGDNTITFSDQDWYSPDVDRITIHELLLPHGESQHVHEDKRVESGENVIDLGERVGTQHFGSIAADTYERGFSISNELVTISYDTTRGLASFGWNDEVQVDGVFSQVQLQGKRIDHRMDGSYDLRAEHGKSSVGSDSSDSSDSSDGDESAEHVKTISSRDFVQHEFSLDSIAVADDPLGPGVKVVVTSRASGSVTMAQSFFVYENQPFFLTEVEVISEDGSPIATNHIAPIVMETPGGVDIGAYDDPRVLVVPFDNDKWSRYEARTINTPFNNEQYISAELTAIFDNTTRNGLVIGTVTHDTWKTGIDWSGSSDRLNRLEVFGGFTSLTSTHDTIPHGNVSGTQVQSPVVFVGFYDDYRDGLTEFGKANAAINPPLAFPDGVPQDVVFGWNSWGALKSDVSFDTIAETSRFFNEHLQHVFHNDGRVYINLDSYWDNLSDAQLGQLVDLIRENGQIPGIYWAPFAYWGSNMKQFVEGTDYKYTYGDIVLKDQDGNILPTLDGAYAVDPTHPGTKQRIDHFIGRFKRLGYEYIKLDFLSHGALEGAHYDPNVMTGIQAYHQGMSYVVDQIDGTMIIAASIAPLFPSQYAHSRRISCDVDGTLALTEYQLNNLTYGWWQHGTIYPFADPDYMTLATAGSLEVARTRVHSAVISGTVFLSSDDVRSPLAREYMVELLTNPQVNALAASGKVFVPVEGNTGDRAADAFVRHDEAGVSYVALFHFSDKVPSTKTLDLARAGLSHAAYRAVDVWTGEETLIENVLQIDLAPGQSKLLRLEVR